MKLKDAIKEAPELAMLGPIGQRMYVNILNVQRATLIQMLKIHRNSERELAEFDDLLSKGNKFQSW